MTPADVRNADGTLLCICGKPQQTYSGRYERGWCGDEECWRVLNQIEENNREFEANLES